jgi:DNA-directed RNA polymerase specialized sigma24 family protein
VDSDDNEVIYPTDVIVELIKLAYKGTSPEEIAKKLGYSLKEIKTMIYDNFENRNL